MMRFAVLVLAFVVGACSLEGDTTGAISSCAKDLFPAYNPKVLDSVRRCLQEMRPRDYSHLHNFVHAKGRALRRRVA
jgi:hypothetical protein